MCDPMTALIAGGAAIVGGSLLSAKGEKKAGRAAEDAANFQAQTAEGNREFAEQLADDAIARGNVEEQKQRVITSQFVARQEVALAASGQVVGVGSAKDLTESTETIGELEALTIRQNALKEAEGFRREGLNFGREAQLTRETGRQAKKAGEAAATASIISGVGSVASSWYSFGNLNSAAPTAGATTEASFQPINTKGGGVVLRGGD